METSNVPLGMTLAILSGAFLGSFAIPMKKVKIWQWENTWIIYSVWATVLLPLLLAVMTVPKLWDVYASVSLATIFTVFLFGAGWGVANVGFGLGLKMVGLALGTVIVLGMNNALVSILPLILYHPEDIAKPVGLALTSGVIVMIVGIVIFSIAGARREKVLGTNDPAAKGSEKGNFMKGLSICVLAGVFGAMFNFALIHGKPIEEQALAHGASTLNAANATWCVSLLGGFMVTLVYGIILYMKNNSFKLYKQEHTSVNWLYTFLMGLMWFGGVAIYGMSVMNLGKLGASIG